MPHDMRSLCVGRKELLQRQASTVEPADIAGTPIWCALLPTAAPAFEPSAAADAHDVLVRVKAFSCNFRDRYLILKTLAEPETTQPFAIGSEFAGDVISVGSKVTRVAVGDRVMGDNAWPDQEPDGWRRGVPTNHASREQLVLHEEKLARIPPGMPDEVAAAFSVGAQTAYSMVSKLEVESGSRVLVTAARSNTSLFSISALRALGVEIYAITASPHAAGPLRELGVTSVFEIDPKAPNWLGHGELRATARRLGGFDAIVDPFADTNLARALPFLKYSGRYVTCGMSDGDLDDTSACQQLRVGLALAIAKNAHLIANCAGLRSHLEAGSRDFTEGRLPVRIDSVFGGNCAAAFLERTFSGRDRLGKVVFTYDGLTPASGNPVANARRA
jgi:NADPH:quinone reductase-like Zn-dependent oxidoreductase